MSRLGKHDEASNLSQEAATYRAQEEAAYKKHFSYEKCLIVTFGLGLCLMTIFGILNLPLGFSSTLFTTNTGINTEWKQLTIDPGSRGYGFSSEALLDADINLPDIKALKGKAKFIDEPGRIRFGYLITVAVEKLDPTKVPKKYRKEREVNAKGGKFTIAPSEQVTYQIHYEFTFRDKDNFVIFSIKSPHGNLTSGKDNQFQGIAEEAIPHDIATRISDIVFTMSIDKCVTCE